MSYNNSLNTNNKINTFWYDVLASIYLKIEIDIEIRTIYLLLKRKIFRLDKEK